MKKWIKKRLLQWIKRDLEKQIVMEKWDEKLSAKIDAVLLLLED